MSESHPTRRSFVATTTSALAAHWLVLALPGLGALAGCARRAAEQGDDLTQLNADEAAALAAFATRILPADDEFPGAEAAGAVHFIDGAIAGPLAELDSPVRELARDLDTRASQRGAASFAALATAEQDAVMTDLDGGGAFEVGRILVIMAVLADPSRGGNRDHAGWDLVQLEHAAAHRPPFGWYDDPANGAPA